VVLGVVACCVPFSPPPLPPSNVPDSNEVIVLGLELLRERNLLNLEGRVLEGKGAGSVFALGLEVQGDELECTWGEGGREGGREGMGGDVSQEYVAVKGGRREVSNTGIKGVVLCLYIYRHRHRHRQTQTQTDT
jgi:hypothetical protein